MLISNSINGLIFFLAAGLISTVIYNYHYEAIAKNIVLEEINFKLDYMSNHCPLTGLLNRRSFETQVAEKMRSITENKKQTVLILMEHIKTNGLATRWGGEEFLIFLFQTSIDEAYALADNIRLAVQNKVIIASSDIEK